MLGERELGGSAAFLQCHGRVPVDIAIERGIDVEGAPGDHQRIDAIEVVGCELLMMRQRDRQTAGGDDGIGVVLADGIPGIFGVAAGLFGIERDADDRKVAHREVLTAGVVRWQGFRR